LTSTSPNALAPANGSGIDAALARVRGEFPALARRHGNQEYSYLDGPGGTQVPRATIAAMTGYLERSNANHEGAFATSEESDARLPRRTRARPTSSTPADPTRSPSVRT